MAAETPRRSMSEDAEARLLILERANEDCYGVKEFIANLLDLYTGEVPASRLDMTKRALVQLSDEGLVRLHWGRQCSGDHRASEELTIQGSQVADLPDEVWVPYTEAMVCVCDTERTSDAYNAAYREMNGEPSA